MHSAINTMTDPGRILQYFFKIGRRILHSADGNEGIRGTGKRPDVADLPLPSDRKRNGQTSVPSEDVQYLASRLDLSISALTQTCSGAEGDFLTIGEHLQSIYAQASQMNENVQAAIEHVGLDNDNPTLSRIIRTAQRVLSGLETEHSGMAARLANIHDMGDTLGSLRGMAGGLRRIAKALKMVAININIESSRAAEYRESFNVLSQEIRALSDTVGSLDETLSDEIQTISGRLASMGQTMKDKLNRFARLTADAKDLVNRAEPECRKLMDRSVEALQHIGTDGESISRNTSQIVVSLQIHDNVSQRVEHITDALADSLQLLRQSDDGQPMSGDVHEQAAAIDANIALQHAQLGDIINDIGQVAEDSGRSFGVIGETVQDMSDNIVQVAKGDMSIHSPEDGKGGSMGSLQAALEKIQSLIGQGDEVVNALKTIGGDAKTAVSRIGELMDQVTTVNFDIHLKSLNAIFKSKQLGSRGRSISVLVQEMKDLATQSKDLVDQIQAINVRMIDLAGGLQERRPEETTGEPVSMVAGSDDLEASIQNFSDTSSAFTHQADEMVQQSQFLGSMIAAAEDQLAFLKPFAAQLQSQKQELAACRDRLAPWVPEKGSARAAALDKSRLAQRYTMQQERDIHKAILNDQSATHDDRTEGPAPGEPDLIALQTEDNTAQAEEFGENVELF